ncbi:MAG: WecB/TagA/CpsF family glycosyltransferase [Oscillospiraceae bacterium]|nr:WecB/TagA/CpsF family glycosyltransferase [Oscillospiraceae bacterium]
MSRLSVLGLSYDNLSRSEAVEIALGLIEERRSAITVTPNSEILLLSRKNPALREAIGRADLTLADGVGVLMASKILGRPLRERVAGIDFATGLMARLAESGGSVFLFGAKPGVAERAAGELGERYPGLRVVGCRNGYFTPDENEAIVREINDAGPDLLLVCLGSPKQELWMAENAEALRTGLMAGLGGALDVFAGLVPRAPERWQRLGLEWLYRLVREPKRFTRVLRLPGVLFAAIWERIRGSDHEQG